jgi:hypothetical protein
MELLQNHCLVLNTFNIRKNQDQFELPYLYIGLRYCIKILTNKDALLDPVSALPLLLTRLPTAIEESLQRYCSNAYSRSGVNQVWILKNSKKK